MAARSNSSHFVPSPYLAVAVASSSRRAAPRVASRQAESRHTESRQSGRTKWSHHQVSPPPGTVCKVAPKRATVVAPPCADESPPVSPPPPIPARRGLCCALPAGGRRSEERAFFGGLGNGLSPRALFASFDALLAGGPAAADARREAGRRGVVRPRPEHRARVGQLARERPAGERRHVCLGSPAAHTASVPSPTLDAGMSKKNSTRHWPQEHKVGVDARDHAVRLGRRVRARGRRRVLQQRRAHTHTR